MSNTLMPGDVRVGQISPTLEITGSVQSATLVFDERHGARLLVPYMPGVDQFAQTEAWFDSRDDAPKRLLFVDPRGSVTLVGLTVLGHSHNQSSVGQFGAEVVIFGQPRRMKDEYRIKAMRSTIDGLDGFADFAPVEYEFPRPGEAAVIRLDDTETVTWRSQGFSYAIRATASASGVEGRRFEATSGAAISTSRSRGATPLDDYRVYTLSNDPATCETTGTVGDATTLTTAGALFAPTEFPMAAAGSTPLAAAIAATPDGPAATQPIVQKALNAARDGTASSSGMSPMADGDGWTPIAFRYQTFIPDAKIGSPGFSGDITHPYIAFNGNDRGFDPAGDYKTREDVLVTFGTGHSITTLTRAVGTTHRYKCTWPWLTSCVETNSATASNDGLAINNVVSTNTGGAFTFHVSAANPLQSVAPPISADLRITMAPHNTWLTGRHDNMPLHEVYLEFPEWENEWYYAYQSWFYDPICLAGQLPGCSTWINIPL